MERRSGEDTDGRVADGDVYCACELRYHKCLSVSKESSAMVDSAMVYCGTIKSSKLMLSSYALEDFWRGTKLEAVVLTRIQGNYSFSERQWKRNILS